MTKRRDVDRSPDSHKIAQIITADQYGSGLNPGCSGECRMQGKLFMGGKWLAHQPGKTIAVIDPGTGEQFGAIADGGAGDIDLAVQAARRALAGEWGRFTAVERGRALMRLGQ